MYQTVWLYDSNLFSFFFLFSEGGVDLTPIQVTLAMLGKFGINSSFTIIYIYGPEIYPTVLR